MEICQDCKDKLVKFYHFKQKAQSQLKNFQMPMTKVSVSTHSNHDDTYQEDLSTCSTYESQLPKKEMKNEFFKIQSAVSLNKAVVIKEEPEEPPEIVFADFSSDLSSQDYPPLASTQRAKRQGGGRRAAGNKTLSKAAMKMRLYRERLKLPQNRDRFLQHQQLQREYNRRHYMRKQGVDMERKTRVNYSEDYDHDDMFIIP